MVFGGLCVLIFVLALSGLYMWRTETGTRYAWTIAKVLSGNRLQGVLERGTLRTGLFLRDIRWRHAGLEVAIDQVQSQWEIQHVDVDSGTFWSWVVPFIRVGEVQIKQGPAPQNPHTNSPISLPKKLSIPFLVYLNEGSVKRVCITQGTQVSEWTNLQFALETIGSGKAQQHHLRLDQLHTPYGVVRADMRLMAASPFGITGTLNLVGKSIPSEMNVSSLTKNLAQSKQKVEIKTARSKSASPWTALDTRVREARFDVQVSGTLEEMAVHIQARGQALKGQGHMEVWPFRPMPLKAATLSIHHLNPQLFSAKAPKADLHIEAQLGPARAPALLMPTSSLNKFKQALKHNLPTSGKSEEGEKIGKAKDAQPWTVEGDITLRNTLPASLMMHGLPLRMARSHLRLNAQEQVLTDIQIQVLQGAVLALPAAFSALEKTAPHWIQHKLHTKQKTSLHTDLHLEGNARFEQDKGLLNLSIRDLDLHRWSALLVPARLNGTLTWIGHHAEHHQDVALSLESATVKPAAAKQTAPVHYACIDASQCDLHHLELPHLAAAHLSEEHKALALRSHALRHTQQSDPAAQTSTQKSPALPSDYLSVEMKAHIQSEQLAWKAEIHTGQGKAQISGDWKTDVANNPPTYTLQSTLDRFDPFAWLSPMMRAYVAAPATSSKPERSWISGDIQVRSGRKPAPYTRLFLHSLKKPDKKEDTKEDTKQNTQSASCIPSASHRCPSEPFSARGSMALHALLEDVKTLSQKTEPALDIEFTLHNSAYQGRPLEAKGQIHTVGQRLLPSHIQLAVAGNRLEAQGEWGRAASGLTVHLDAPDLSTIGWGFSGMFKADGQLQGGFEHPQLALRYLARGVSVGPYRLQSAKGQARLEQGANGALSYQSDVQGLVLPQGTLDEIHIQLAGIQARHTLNLQAKGLVQKQAIDFTLAARGGVRVAENRPAQTANNASQGSSAPDTSDGSNKPGLHWKGSITQLTHHGLPEVRLDAPVTLGWTIAKSAPSKSTQTAAPSSAWTLTQLDIGQAQMHIEGAQLDLQALHYSPRQSHSAGTLKGIDLRHLTRKLHDALGINSPLSFIAIDAAVPVYNSLPISPITDDETPQSNGPETDLVLDSAWNLTQQAMHITGHAQLQRRTGDLVIQTALGGRIPLDLQTLALRLNATSKKGMQAQLQAKSGQFGAIDAHLDADLPAFSTQTRSLETPTTRADFLGASSSPLDAAVPTGSPFPQNHQTVWEIWKQKAPLAGEITVNLPDLDPIGNALGANMRLSGAARLRLQLKGVAAHPLLSGRLDAERLGIILIQEGLTLKDGVAHIGLSNNTVDFEQITFKGESGAVTLSGKAKIDPANPSAPLLDAHITAQKLAVFATLDRQLALSGQARVQYAGPGLPGADQPPLSIEGDFVVDRALFDIPNGGRPQLGQDVIEVDRALWKARQREKKKAKHKQARALGDSGNTASQDSEMRLDDDKALASPPASLINAPLLAKIHLDLGQHTRFRGAGADVHLTGALDIRNTAENALQANGDLRMQPGSTFEAFGRKLQIEKGYFAFQGPLNNPGIHILAMRRNQEVEAGVLVTGTFHAPDIRLVSEPTVADSEKLSWLLFGHGTSGGTNLGQQNTTMAALALLGNASGKRIAKTIGLDEFTIGQSESGLSDPQVLSVAKALNERLILGYEQGLTTAASLVKLTWQLSRRWSLTVHTGTLNGVDIIHRKRFDKLVK